MNDPGTVRQGKQKQDQEEGGDGTLQQGRVLFPASTARMMLFPAKKELDKDAVGFDLLPASVHFDDLEGCLRSLDATWPTLAGPRARRVPVDAIMALSLNDHAARTGVDGMS